MKTMTAAVLCLSLGLAGAASAKLPRAVCEAGAASKHAQACHGTPFAEALLDARTVVCLFDYPETGDMDAFLKAKTGAGKFVLEKATATLIKLDTACRKLKAGKK